MLPLLLCAGVSLGTAPARAELNVRTAALVKQLGDPAFRKREAAAAQLIELGNLARPALEAARDNPNAEVRDRAKHLLPKALEVEIRRRVARFRADPAGVGFDLPGWKTFRGAVGDDPASRAFFVDTFLENLELLQGLEADPLKAWRIYGQRTLETQLAIQAQWNMQPRRGRAPRAPEPVVVDIRQFAALMIVGMDEGVRAARAKAKPQANNANVLVGFGWGEESYPLAAFMAEAYFREYLTQHAEAPRFKKLFLEWLEAQVRSGPSGESTEIYFVMEAIKKIHIKETVGFVERMVRAKETPVEIRAQAIICLAAFGDLKHKALLAPLLKDKTQVSSFSIGNGGGNKEYRTELRDVALGITIKLSGQKPSQYGFEGMTVFGGDDDNLQYYSFSFTAEEKRAAAHKKWDDFVAGLSKEKK